MKEKLLVYFGISVCSGKKQVPYSGVFPLVLFGVSDRPGIIAGRAFLKFQIERLSQRVRLADKSSAERGNLRLWGRGLVDCKLEPPSRAPLSGAIHCWPSQRGSSVLVFL